MKFVVLIALDTVRSIRRHRVMLAFVLLALAGTGLVTTGIARSARHIEQTEALKPHAAEDTPAAGAADPTRIKVHEMEEFFNAAFAWAMSFFGSLLSLIVFCTVVYSEVHTGTIRVTLAKPVPRWSYLLGKWMGATAIVAGYCVVAGAAAAVIGVAYDAQGLWTLAFVPWLTFCGSIVVGAVGLVYSLFVRPPVAGVLAWFTSATWVTGFKPLYAVLPSYQPFDVFQMMTFGTPLGAWSMVITTLYAIDLVAILLLVAFVRFRRMEIA